MPVAEMLNTVSANEMLEWRAYYSIFPFTDDRADINASMIQATNVNMNSKKRYSYTDFMPKYGETAEANLMAKFVKLGKILSKVENK